MSKAKNETKQENRTETVGPVGAARILVSVEQMNAQAAERRAQRDADNAKPPEKLSVQGMLADTFYTFKCLHGFDKAVDFKCHMFDENGKKIPLEICNRHYNEPCRLCDLEKYPDTFKFFVSWVFNLVGATFPKTDPATGQVRQCKYNPIKLMGVPHGKKDANLKNLYNVARLTKFESVIWKLYRTKGVGGGVQPPEMLTEEEFHALVGQDNSTEIGKAAVPILDWDADQIFKYIGTALANFRWEKFGLEKPVVAEVEEEVVTGRTEVAQPTSAASAVDELLGG